jgi:hypothetical protein
MSQGLSVSDRLKDAVLEALRARRPIDEDSGLSAALAVLDGNPDEQFQFKTWYMQNGLALVKIINSGR